MSRQDKTLPPRRRRATSDVSLLIRSAETLGKLIGALQRQLDGASKRANGVKPANKTAATASATSRARTRKKAAAPRRDAGAGGKNSKGRRRTS